MDRKKSAVVESRLFINPLDEQVGPASAPLLECLNGREMIESPLGNAVVVGGRVMGQRDLEFFGAGEAGLGDDLADAAVEALDHAVGLGVAWRAQPVLDSKRLAALVEGMLAAGGSGPAGEPVGELAAVVGQHGLDLHRRGLTEPAQEVRTAGLALVGVDAQEHPACGAVDGHEQVASRRLVGHLRQVLDVHMHEARLVVLERLGRRRGVADEFGLQRAQVGHAVTAQAAVQARAGGVRVDELARDDQQIIQRQQDQAAQLDHDGLLRGGERRAQGVRTVGEILGRFTALPLAHRGHADVVALGQFRQGSRTGLDLGSCARSRAGLGVDFAHVAQSCRSDSMTPRIRSLALNSGQLRVGT